MHAGPTLQNVTLSIVVPAYNESTGLIEFHQRTSRVLDSLGIAAEIVFVNDGSTDDTLQVMKKLKESDPRVAIVDLSRNFGKEIALTAGLDHTIGDAVVVIDADLQDPPEFIPTLVDYWKNGFDVVYATRAKRLGESWIKKATAGVFYRMMEGVGAVKLPRDTGDFRILSRRAVDALLRLRERHRFMKGLFAWIGFRQIGVPYVRDARFAGSSTWNYWKLWNLAIEGFTSFTVVPLKMSTYIGIAAASGALIYGMVIVGRTLLFGRDVPGYPSIMTVVLFLGGMQLMALGILGEYVGRMFNEVKQRPLYLAQEYLPSREAEVATRPTVSARQLRQR